MRPDCNDIQLVAAIARALVLVIAALGGLLTIYLGWKLYKDALLSKVEGSATFHGMKFKMVAAGPGVFFAIFGMYLLVSIVKQPAHFSTHTDTETRSEKGAFKRSPSDYGLQPLTRLYGAELVPVAGSDVNAATQNNGGCIVSKTSTSSDTVFYTGGELKPAEVDGALKVAISNLEDIENRRDPTELPILNRRRAIQILKQVRENEVK